MEEGLFTLGRGGHHRALCRGGLVHTWHGASCVGLVGKHARKEACREKLWQEVPGTEQQGLRVGVVAGSRVARGECRKTAGVGASGLGRGGGECVGRWDIPVGIPNDRLLAEASHLNLRKLASSQRRWPWLPHLIMSRPECWTTSGAKCSGKYRQRCRFGWHSHEAPSREGG